MVNTLLSMTGRRETQDELKHDLSVERLGCTAAFRNYGVRWTEPLRLRLPDTRRLRVCGNRFLRAGRNRLITPFRRNLRYGVESYPSMISRAPLGGVERHNIYEHARESKSSGCML